jgi:hypothetical protein
MADFREVFRIASQLDEAHRTGAPPTILTPAYITAGDLVVIAIRAHQSLQPAMANIAHELPGVSARNLVLLRRAARGNLERMLDFLEEAYSVAPAESTWSGVGVVYSQETVDAELVHAAYVSATCKFAEAAQRVQRYALADEAVRLVLGETLRRLELLGESARPATAAFLLAEGFLPEHHADALSVLRWYAGRVRHLPGALCGIVPPGEPQWRGQENGATSLKTQYILEAIEKLKEHRGGDALFEMLVAGARDLTHLPNAVRCDIQNEIARWRREDARFFQDLPGGTEKGGDQQDIAKRFAEALGMPGAIEAEGGVGSSGPPTELETLALLRALIQDPPEDFLRIFSEGERRIFDEHRKSHLGITSPYCSNRDLAERAGCSPALVSAFWAKVRQYFAR